MAKEDITNWIEKGMILSGAPFKVFGMATLALPRVGKIFEMCKEEQLISQWLALKGNTQ